MTTSRGIWSGLVILLIGMMVMSVAHAEVVAYKDPTGGESPYFLNQMVGNGQTFNFSGKYAITNISFVVNQGGSPPFDPSMIVALYRTSDNFFLGETDNVTITNAGLWNFTFATPIKIEGDGSYGQYTWRVLWSDAVEGNYYVPLYTSDDYAGGETSVGSWADVHGWYVNGDPMGSWLCTMPLPQTITNTGDANTWSDSGFERRQGIGFNGTWSNVSAVTNYWCAGDPPVGCNETVNIYYGGNSSLLISASKLRDESEGVCRAVIPLDASFVISGNGSFQQYTVEFGNNCGWHYGMGYSSYPLGNYGSYSGYAYHRRGLTGYASPECVDGTPPTTTSIPFLDSLSNAYGTGFFIASLGNTEHGLPVLLLGLGLAVALFMVMMSIVALIKKSVQK